MDHQKYKPVKRKFHDAWAFILFIITTSLANAAYIYSNPTHPITKEIENRLLINTVLYMGTVISAITLCMLLIPGPIMHFSFLALPFIEIAFAVYFNNTVMLVMSLIYGAISLFLYFFYYKKNIKYSASVVKGSSSIILNNFLNILPVVIFSIAAILAQIFVACKYLDTKYQENYLLYIVCVLQMYWTLFAFQYFIRVYVSSVVTLNLLIVENISIAYESIKNTLFCVGSICFGSLLVALITTLRHLQRKSRSEGRRSLASEILYIIIDVILSILQDIMEFINEWVFVYMALYGESYVNSIKSAYNNVAKGANNTLINSLCVFPMLGLFSLSIAIGYIALIIFMYDVVSVTYQQWLGIVAVGLSVFLVINVYMIMWDAAVKAFLFGYDKEPYSVRNKFPETYEMLEEQKRKI